jgi:hypothetical protein
MRLQVSQSVVLVMSMEMGKQYVCVCEGGTERDSSHLIPSSYATSLLLLL